MPAGFLTSDIRTITASSDFGEAAGDVTYQGVTLVGGIFDNGHVDESLGEGVGTIASEAQYTGSSSDFTDIEEGHLMTIRGDTYRIVYWMDDGTGVTEVYLEKQT